MSVAQLRGYATLTRAYMSAMIGVTAICGLRLSLQPLNASALVLAFLSQFGSAAAAFAINDVLDVDRDRSMSWKPLVNGTLSLRQGKAAALVLAVLAVATSSLLGILPLAIVLLQLVIAVVYSEVKRNSGFWANLITAATCASAFLFGAAVGRGLGLAWIPAVLSTQLLTAREIAKDTLDMAPDRAAGLPTLPVKYGMRVSLAVVVSLVCSVVMVSMLPVIRGSFHTGYFVLMNVVNVMLLVALARFLQIPDERGAKWYMVVTAAAFPIALAAFCL